ncbi:hypothetical protein P2318_16560 [Myxococcaceae bacterium GXIMD 01537]
MCRQGRGLLALAVLLAGGLLPMSAKAEETASASVDQVLAALAEVVKERAEQVAARTIVRKLEDKVCSGTLELKRKVSRPGAAKPDYEVYLSLSLGGSPACKEDAKACTSDDVFASACRLIEQDAMTLTDPHFLKTLSREAVSLLIRSSAGHLSREQYDSLGFPALADYVHGAMEVLAVQGGRLTDLAQPTLVLADRLSPGLPQRTLAALGEDASTKALLRSSEAWLDASCKAAPDSFACHQLDTFRSLWFPSVLDANGQPLAEGCDAFMKEEAHTARGDVLNALFLRGTPQATPPVPPPFGLALERPCEARYQGAQLTACNQSQVLVKLSTNLVKLVCFGQRGGSAEPWAPRIARGDLRQLGYVLAERGVYEAAFGAQAFPGVDARRSLTAFLDKSRSLNVEDSLPREELANGFRLLGAALQAHREAPQATAAWLALLRDDSRRFLRGQGALDFESFLRSPSLSVSAPLHLENGLEPESLRDLREAARDFLTLPSLYVYRDPVLAASARQARLAAVDMAAGLSGVATGSARESLIAMAGFVKALSEQSSLLGVEIDEKQRRGVALSGDEQARLQRLAGTARAFAETSSVLRLAAHRDWVGLAVDLADELRTSFADVDAVARPTTFLRVLLSMYQASSVDEAKNIFKSTLVDEASRQRRYEATTLDVAALVGVRGGYQHQSTAPVGSRGSGIYGLYAPLGVQWARRWGGLLVYPVDLGTYLVAREGSEDAPQWADALRLGATVYARPWADVPVVFGAGGDYRMKVVGPSEVRVVGHVSLELPLYTLF